MILCSSKREISVPEMKGDPVPEHGNILDEIHDVPECTPDDKVDNEERTRHKFGGPKNKLEHD